jgi:apolipoprotein D and lipocalin family protein
MKARFKFEKGLNNTSAEYSLKDNGTIKVDNKGYDVKMTNGSKASEKQSLLRGECSHAKSVMGLFWGIMLFIDKEYKYALVAGGALTIYGYCLSQFR